MPSTVCPIPTAYTPEQALQAYLNAKKKMPDLSPAAWRKQAAIDLGMDYDSYLALWKVHKGSVSVAKSLGIAFEPVSTATLPASLSSAPKMGITHAPPDLTYDEIKLAVDYDSFKVKPIITTDYTPQGTAFKFEFQNSVDYHDALEVLDAGGMDYMASGNVVKVFKAQKTSGSGKSLAKSVKGTDPDLPTGMWDQFFYAEKQYQVGGITADDALKIYDDLAAKTKDKNLLASIKGNKAALKPVQPASTAKVLSEAGEKVIQTAHGPLTHDLASNVYKVMKKNMPGATPAQLRHAAADYLGVDYNAYLKAWKKPTSAAQKAAQTSATKLPPPTTTPVSPTTAGKYSKQDITPDQLKDELARAYGPGANKNFIQIEYDDATATYQVAFPNSLLPTPAAQQGAKEALERLGLEVKKTNHASGNIYKIKSPASKETAAKNAKQIEQTGTYTLPDGKVVLDNSKADEWTSDWWSDLTSAEHEAWKKYTGPYYSDINRFWRKGGDAVDWDQWQRGVASSSIKSWSTHLSGSMQEVKNEFTVFRGTGIDIDKFVKGKVWTDEGFVSTAINPASSWGGVKFEITMPKGSRGMYIGKKSSHPYENEFLIDRDTKFRILEVDKGKNIVRLIAIPKA